MTAGETRGAAMNKDVRASIVISNITQPPSIPGPNQAREVRNVS